MILRNKLKKSYRRRQRSWY